MSLIADRERDQREVNGVQKKRKEKKSQQEK
jgi:hypothetical protein